MEWHYIIQFSIVGVSFRFRASLCALTENACPGNIEWMVDQALHAHDELIRFGPLNMPVERRFIDPARIEPEQP
jgi:hypothetical protein